MEMLGNKIYSHSIWIGSQIIYKEGGKKKKDDYHNIIYLLNK